jgi:hypothetical protein
MKAIKTTTNIYYFNSGRQLPQVADLGSVCGMPQEGYRKPPARLAVMTNFPQRIPTGIKNFCLFSGFCLTKSGF